jgi:hypothetical protein
MEICRLPRSIDEVAIHSGLVDPIQLALELEQIGFTQGPSLSHGQPLQLIPNFDKTSIWLLESLIDLTFSVRGSQCLIRKPRLLNEV